MSVVWFISENKIAVKNRTRWTYFPSSKQFRPLGKRGSENMKISGWDCDFDSWSKFSILLTTKYSPGRRRGAPCEGTINSARLFTPGERKALAKSKVHQWSRAWVINGVTEEVNTDMNVPSNCWLFCVTRNSHFRRAPASVVLKFNKESNRKTPFERRKVVFLKHLRYRRLFLEWILQE